MNKILEKRRPGYIGAELIVAATVATASNAKVAPMEASPMMPVNVERTSSSQRYKPRKPK